MPARLSDFEAIPGMAGFFSATNGKLRCTAISLRSGGICLHSPVQGFSPGAESSLDRLGDVRFLLAPNHYHNKGLGEYAGRFPGARLVAPEASRPRLQKVTGLKFEDLEALEPDMPDGARIVTPAGLKTGEIWIVTVTGWVVVDAFAGSTGGDPSPRLLSTFPRYGVADKTKYSRWVEDFIGSNPPQTLVPCHGDIVHDPELRTKLTDLVEQEI